MAGAKKKGGGGKPKAAKANGHADPTEKKTRQRQSPAGMGHNLTEIKKQALNFAARYNKLLDEKEELNGGIMSDVKNLLEEGADKIGCSRKILRMVLSEKRREMKRKEKEAELETQERGDLETLQDALGLFQDTPLGRAAVKAEQEGATA